MKAFVYSVYDTKMEVFAPPFLAQNDAVAQRVFGDMGQSNDFPYRRHPKDYCLFLVGEWDDHSGAIVGVKPKSLGLLPSGSEAGAELMKSVNPDIE